MPWWDLFTVFYVTALAAGGVCIVIGCLRNPLPDDDDEYKQKPWF